MKKEFGKWLMDIAKYIATAVILSSVFGDMDRWILYVGGGLSVLVALICGLYMVSDTPMRIRRPQIRNRNTNSTQS
jgi:hypothetical protein